MTEGSNKHSHQNVEIKMNTVIIILKITIKELLQRINTFSEVARYKIN